ncbi:MAG: roadblock/LC7 domain-containing protein [Planctomycetota bacterium]
MKDVQLRDARLVFYKEDVTRLNKILDELLKACEARSALLVDRDGHMVTWRGDNPRFDPDTVSALIAGSYAATREIARLLGEDEFTHLFQQGTRDNIHLTMVGERALLTILFDDQTTLGMVRLYVKEAATRLEEVFKTTQARVSTGTGAPKDYARQARNQLDGFFDALG